MSGEIKLGMRQRLEAPDAFSAELNLYQCDLLTQTVLSPSTYCVTYGQYPYREIFNVAPEGSPEYNGMVKATKLRYGLKPYINSLPGMTYFDDYTIMRALVMDFGNHKKVEHISDEHMFGPSVLFAPVTTYKAREKKIYLPAGPAWCVLGEKSFRARAHPWSTRKLIKGPALRILLHKKDEMN